MLVLRFGDGSFFIPYILSMVLVGIPMVYLESSIAQFSHLSIIQVWKCSPLFKGVGVAMLLISSFLMVYYPVIVSYSLIYFVHSVKAMAADSPLPWSVVDNSAQNGAVFLNATQPVFNAEDFFLNHVMYQEPLTDDPFDFGRPVPAVLLALFVTWLLSFLALMDGIESITKAALITVPVTAIIWLVTIFKSISIDGANLGYEKLFAVEWSNFYEPDIWRLAMEQTLFSLGISYGGLFVFGSYNPFHRNIHRGCLHINSSRTNHFGKVQSVGTGG